MTEDQWTERDAAMQAGIDTFRQRYRELTEEPNLDNETLKVAALMLNVLSEAESRLVFDADDKPADNVM